MQALICPTNLIGVFVVGVATLMFVDSGDTVSVMVAKLCREIQKVTTLFLD